MEVYLWLAFLVTIPGAVASALQVYDWYKKHSSKKKRAN